MFLNLSREDGSRPPTWASEKKEYSGGSQLTNNEVMRAYGALI